MAIVKHIKSRNANYSAAINYLLFEHDEKTGKIFAFTVMFTTPAMVVAPPRLPADFPALAARYASLYRFF